MDLADLQTKILNIQADVAELVSIVTKAWTTAVLKNTFGSVITKR